MRHKKSFNHLGRKSAHRKAMLANMASSLILHKRITTTTAKAKALRSYVEPLITRTKNLASIDEKTHAQRVVFSYLQNKYAVKELFSDVAEKVAERPGGYTRILKTGYRLGDSAEMCIIELVDYNENMLAGAVDKKAKSKRRRGSKKKPVMQATDTIQEASDITGVEDGDVEVSDKKSKDVSSEITDDKVEAKEKTDTTENDKIQTEVKEEIKKEKFEEMKEIKKPEIKKDDIKAEKGEEDTKPVAEEKYEKAKEKEDVKTEDRKAKSETTEEKKTEKDKEAEKNEPKDTNQEKE